MEFASAKSGFSKIIFYENKEVWLEFHALEDDKLKLQYRKLLKEGAEVEAKFVGVDRKNRTISLSVKAKDADEEAQVIQGYTRDASSSTTTLGDLLKEQMEDEKK